MNSPDCWPERKEWRVTGPAGGHPGRNSQVPQSWTPERAPVPVHQSPVDVGRWVAGVGAGELDAEWGGLPERLFSHGPKVMTFSDCWLVYCGIRNFCAVQIMHKHNFSDSCNIEFIHLTLFACPIGRKKSYIGIALTICRSVHHKNLTLPCILMFLHQTFKLFAYDQRDTITPNSLGQGHILPEFCPFLYMAFVIKTKWCKSLFGDFQEAHMEGVWNRQSCEVCQSAKLVQVVIIALTELILLINCVLTVY